jgi:glycosyltransferase involved in cell wall biosynthesis
VLLFVGSNHASNLEGLEWFLERVWPVVRTHCPAAKVLVAGSICDLLHPDAHERVTLLGPVADLADVYARSALVIAPILKGSGFKIKVLEAASHGRTCVTTTVGIEGAECLSPPFWVADTPSQFADCIIEGLGDIERLAALGRQAAETAATHFATPACYAALDEALVACIPSAQDRQGIHSSLSGASSICTQ